MIADCLSLLLFIYLKDERLFKVRCSCKIYKTN